MEYFYYQPTGESAWEAADASLRSRITEELAPAFVTVLNIDTLLDDSSTQEDYAAAKYAGPMYCDIDAENLDQGILQFNRLLDKVEDLGIKLTQCRLYATGGRGFHIEIPAECFTSKPRLMAGLPAVYKELAYALFVDCLDMRVYSAKRGRMWRTPNVQRDNGRYKVRVSAEDVRAMDEEAYKAVCSRVQCDWTPAPPTLALKAAQLWTQAVAKMETAVKRKRSGKADEALLKKFDGEFPPTLLKIMSGEVRATEGFNKVALQIGIATSALGKDPDDVLKMCDGLIANHESDGSRYNTPAKRWRNLRDMLRYTSGNPCYDFSAGAVVALLPKGTECPDLRGDRPARVDDETDAAAAPDDEKESLDAIQYDRLSFGLKVRASEVVTRSDDGAGKALSNARIHACRPLLNMEGLLVAYETTYVVDGRRRVTIQVPVTELQSPKSYTKLVMPYGIAWQGNDSQTQAYARLHQINANWDMAEYLVPREGVDIVERPGSRGVKDVVWVATDTVFRHASREMPDDPRYRFRGAYSPEGILRTDLHHAPDIEDAQDAVAEFLFGFTGMNNANAIGNILGWAVSCFFRQFHHATSGQFPLLMVYGEAGSGKTTTVEYISRMFYYDHKPLILQTAATTLHALQGSLVSSASVPVILDEYKPRQMPYGHHARLLNLFRGLYNAGDLAKGGLSEDAANWRGVGRMACAAPLLFIGEAVETETATLERTLTVPFKRQSDDAAREAKDLAADNREAASVLGKAVMRTALMTEIPAFRSEMRETLKEVREHLRGSRQKDRVIYNIATALHGLRTLWAGLQAWLSPEQIERLEERFESMFEAVMDASNQAGMAVMSEASKVLHMMAAISHMDEDQTSADSMLVPGQDYAYVEIRGLKVLDLNMRTAYIKYVTFCRRRGFVPLYDEEESFTHGLKHYQGLVSETPDSPLRDFTPSAKVFRFDADIMRKEGVDPFKD